ncbi:MAG: SDR family oxidoreductase [Rhodospirillales bacterium]|nr:SDR family oxidoreductase [Rhodospirillales bacterium]
MLLQDRVAVITGAASARGIGRATARLFAGEGARVAILDLAAQDPRARAAELGPDHLGLACDLRDRDACNGAVEAIAGRFGRIDTLIGNAGVVYGTPLAEIVPQEYDEVLDVNLRGNFQMAQAVLPHMPRGGGSAMVFVSSIAGQVGGGLFGRSHYAAAKSGIFGLAKALARELAPEGIRVNAVAPGVIDNDFTRGRMTPEDKARIAKTVPLGRLGSSEDVAQACLYLASDMAAYVTGQVLSVNGGLHMY